MKIATMKELMNAYPKLSLKRICDETELCYQYILKASKQPIPNTPYDPKAFNELAVNTIVERKKIDFNAYDWSAIEESVKTYEPLDAIEKFEVGTRFTMRAATAECEVVFLNNDDYDVLAEIVFRDSATGKCRVMNVDTFAHQSPRIVK